MTKEKLYSTSALIILAYIAFISLGLPDGLLGVAWPSIRINFSRLLDSLGILIIASTAGYLVSSFYGGKLVAFLGVGWVLSLSCFATGAGLLGYTFAPYWWMMIPLAAVAGLGAGAIDTGLNTYVASNFGERLMQWLHASFGIGITLGPIIMTAGLNIFSSWRWGYHVVGSAQIFLALCFALTVSLWKGKSNTGLSEEMKTLTDYKTPLLETLRQLDVWISMLLFFVYAGIEVSVGVWTYSLLTESRNISTELAGICVGVYWGTFTIGRILAGIFTKHISMHSLIRFGLLGAFAGAVLLLWNPFPLSCMPAVAVIGFSIAPIFPGMVSTTSSRVTPKYAANTIGMQISSAGLGVAVIPSLTGVIAQRSSLEIIPLLVIVWVIALLGLYTVSLSRVIQSR